jgi:hypothetical protein
MTLIFNYFLPQMNTDTLGINLHGLLATEDTESTEKKLLDRHLGRKITGCISAGAAL